RCPEAGCGEARAEDDLARRRVVEKAREREVGEPAAQGGGPLPIGCGAAVGKLDAGRGPVEPDLVAAGGEDDLLRRGERPEKVSPVEVLRAPIEGAHRVIIDEKIEAAAERGPGPPEERLGGADAELARAAVGVVDLDGEPGLGETARGGVLGGDAAPERQVLERTDEVTDGVLVGRVRAVDRPAVAAVVELDLRAAAAEETQPRHVRR